VSLTWGAIHLQVNATVWPRVEATVQRLAERQRHDPYLGVLVENIDDDNPSSILQYVRYRNFSSYVFPLESTEEAEIEEQIVRLYDKIPLEHQRCKK
jgi:hypothetical protein